MNLLLAFFSFTTLATEPDLFNANLEDLLNMKTAVATKTEETTRSTPSAVTIITENEIHNMGARDLMDVLSLVPSITFGYDVQGVAGLGMRGMWAHEGKFLLIVDGVEMNEIQYGTTHFGNEFPVNQIKRVEIIRGPGSAIYGGFAELAVVNIITKGGADLKGAEADVTYGRMKKSGERRNFGVAAGNTFGADWQYSVAGYMGHGKRGEGIYTGSTAPEAGSVEFADADNLNPGFFNAGLSNKNLNLRFVHEDYRSTTRTMYGFTGLDVDIPIRFRSYNLLASYDIHLPSRWTIKPHVQYNMQVPWEQTTDEARILAKTYKIISRRLKAGTTASYDRDQWNFLAGYEYVSDTDRIDDQRDAAGAHVPFKTGENSMSFDSRAALGQVLYKSGGWTAVAGARYENPTFTADTFVPRLGVTFEQKIWHAKALYSQAYRTPLLQNVNSAPEPIEPEKTQTYEVEYGHAVGQESYLTLNVFSALIKDPIVYYFDTEDRYANFGEVGTSGAELEYRWKPRWGQMQFAYSYYEINHNNVEKYRVVTDDDALIGMPQHKGVVNGWINTGCAGLRVNPGLIYFGEKYGWEYDEPSAAMEVRKTSERWIANLFLTKQDLGVKGLEAGLGVFNLFNSDVRLTQPYDGGHSPVPGPSREFAARVEYKLGF